jgi:dihydrofolate synthase/folylpolyglutamate synthase
LIGDYQTKQKKTVLQTIRVLLLKPQFKVNEEAIELSSQEYGFTRKMATTKASPKTICDTAHNKEGLAIVLNQIQKEKYKQLHIILGVVNDKNLDEVLPLFLRRLFIILQTKHTSRTGCSCPSKKSNRI